MRLRELQVTGAARGSWRFAPTALAVTAAAAFSLGGCSPSGPSAGHSLNPNHNTISGLAPIRPGDEIGMLFLDLQNQSDSVLTLDSIGFPGRGAGTVVRIIEVKIAPDVNGDLSVPGGAYQTDPPVNWWAPTRSCGKQVLVPLKGFRLPAGAIARVWVVLRARAPGKFLIGHIVRYTQNGSRFQQRIQEYVKGTVAAQASHLPMDPSEKRCIKSTKTRLLPYP